MNGQDQKIVCAIAGIVILDSVALSQGIDGSMLALSFASIGALAGVSAAKSKTISPLIDKLFEDST